MNKHCVFNWYNERKFITNVFYQVPCGNFDNMLYRISHIDQFFPVMLLRALKPFMTQETLVILYYAYFHSIMN
jgi:hypothetical protein